MSVSTTLLSENNGSSWRKGLKDSLPVMIGFIPFALVLGANAAQKELAPWEVALMTALNFGGGSEFAAIELWTSPPHLLLIVAVTLLINSRHLLMGMVLAPLMRHLPARKALPALFFMCDESWAMGLAEARRKRAGAVRPVLDLSYYLGVSAGLYTTWVAFTALGAAFGARIGDMDQWGFDMAFPAVFMVLLSGMWKGHRNALPWLVSLVVAGATSLWVPGAWYIIAGALAGLIAAVVLVEQHP